MLHHSVHKILGHCHYGGDLEADNDSVYGQQSATTSLCSRIIDGLIDNGRRYQVIRDGGVNIPSDERQFDSMEADHMAYTVLESEQENPYFRSRLSPKAQHILDLGTGKGDWPIAVADKFPNTTVHGIDLYLPPQKWVPPNCIFEVDDICKPFTWNVEFDLIHIRGDQWESLYKRAYDHLAPGGWIEHVNTSLALHCDDSTMPSGSLLSSQIRQLYGATR